VLKVEMLELIIEDDAVDLYLEHAQFEALTCHLELLSLWYSSVSPNGSWNSIL
jgi:hypothetical protein